jgi:hypothetical protein
LSSSCESSPSSFLNALTNAPKDLAPTLVLISARKASRPSSVLLFPACSSLARRLRMASAASVASSIHFHQRLKRTAKSC